MGEGDSKTWEGDSKMWEGTPKCGWGALKPWGGPRAAFVGWVFGAGRPFLGVSFLDSADLSAALLLGACVEGQLLRDKWVPLTPNGPK